MTSIRNLICSEMSGLSYWQTFFYDGGVGHVMFVNSPFSSNSGVEFAGKSRNACLYVFHSSSECKLTSRDCEHFIYFYIVFLFKLFYTCVNVGLFHNNSIANSLADL